MAFICTMKWNKGGMNTWPVETTELKSKEDKNHMYNVHILHVLTEAMLPAESFKRNKSFD